MTLRVLSVWLVWVLVRDVGAEVLLAAPAAQTMALAGSAAETSRERTMQEAHEAHVAALEAADAAVERARPQAERDPLRPIYHVKPAARWVGDPNGPIYFGGEYHIFFQHLPFAGEKEDTHVMWGHAASRDLVHWHHLPIALAPNPGSYDAELIASGCCVVHDGVPTIIYTAVGPQTQCLATSTDSLRTWRKDPANPVIPAPPPLPGLESGFRDPFAWREGQEWRMLVGSGFAGQGGTALLYRSEDLRRWELLGSLCDPEHDGMGERCFQWECPNFFRMGDRHVLVISPLFRDEPGLRGSVEYAVGHYQSNRFKPGPWLPVDLGGSTVYYAPNSFEDPKGRRVLWGWLGVPRPAEMGWSNCLSLPRVLTLAADATLRYEPLAELAALRRNGRTHDNLTLEPNQEVVLEQALGMHGEIMAEIELTSATRVELRVNRDAEGRCFNILAYDATAEQLTFGDKRAALKLPAGESTLRLRLFLDGLVGEAYVNNLVCFSNVLHVSEQATGVSVVAVGGTALVKHLSAWEMGSIWQE